MELEALESRRMYSVSQVGAVLFVSGTADVDDVAITEDTAGINVESVAYTGVKLVIVSLGDGNDSLNFTLKTASLVVSAGGGDDMIIGTVLNGRDVTVDTGSGSNIVDVIGDSSRCGIARITGGSSTDSIFVSSFDKAFINTGSGDDFIFTSGVKDQVIDAGGGDDTVEVENASGSAVIFGGSGVDSITTSGTGRFVVIDDRRPRRNDDDRDCDDRRDKRDKIRFDLRRHFESCRS